MTLDRNVKISATTLSINRRAIFESNSQQKAGSGPSPRTTKISSLSTAYDGRRRSIMPSRANYHMQRETYERGY